MIHNKGLWTVCALALLTVPDLAAAQDVTRGETVLNRQRPELDPLGVRLGGFLLFPQLGLQGTYDDNIFSTDTNEESDFVTTIEPSLDLNSNWNNHALQLHADSRVVRFADNTSEDFEDYTLSGDGRLDVTRDIQLFGGAGYRIRHEDRSSPDDAGGREPTEFSVTGANLGGAIRFNRMSLRLDNRFERYRFDNAEGVGGVTIYQGDRDRDEITTSLQVGYELAPLREVFVRGTYNWREYEDAVDSAGFNRDSDGYELVVGMNYDLTGVTFLEAFVGYREQSYDDPRLSNVDGIGGGANLVWNVTRLTTVTGGFSRSVGETTLGNASGFMATRLTGQVDHELLRNLLLNGRVSLARDDYEGINREDDYLEFGIGAKYQMNRNLSVSAGYTFRQRDSNSPNDDFDRNLIMLRVGARL